MKIGILPCPETGLKKLSNLIRTLFPDAIIISVLADRFDVDYIKKLIADNDLSMLFVRETLGIDIAEINKNKTLVFPIHVNHLYAKRSEWYKEHGMPNIKRKANVSD